MHIVYDIKCFVALKRIAIYKPHTFLDAISSNTVDISSLEGYHSVTKVKFKIVLIIVSLFHEIRMDVNNKTFSR